VSTRDWPAPGVLIVQHPSPLLSLAFGVAPVKDRPCGSASRTLTLAESTVGARLGVSVIFASLAASSPWLVTVIASTRVCPPETLA
jgi:hypothetical protein